MKDIDFDELDRAVSSIMTKGSREAPSSSDVQVPSEATDASFPEARVDSSNAAAETPSTMTVPVTVRQPRPTVTPPKRGRFMDMVPSKPSTVIPARPTKVAAPLRTEKATEASSAMPSLTQQSQPLDSSDPTNMPPPHEETSPTGSASAPESTAEPDIYESPFLSDAKVEKRPLNSNPSAESSVRIDVSASPKATTQVDQQPPSFATELDRQIAELESEEIADDAVSPPAEAAEPTPIDHRLETGKAEATSAAAPMVPSIPQQYKEKPSTGDQSHTSIYDQTQFAPEPLVHPAKSKAGWLWVVWVVLLLAFGAGAAVLLYMVGII